MSFGTYLWSNLTVSSNPFSVGIKLFSYSIINDNASALMEIMSGHCSPNGINVDTDNYANGCFG